MKVIHARNVHCALPEGIRYLNVAGRPRETRAGEVLQADGPVTTVYAQPTERVLFWEKRDANPFFHLFESLWMLAGRNDVGWITQILESFARFSDDGETFHGAYGFRWRNLFQVADEEGNIFPIDQLYTCIRLLRANPDDRRVVLTMWDPQIDLAREGKDFPCNTHIYFSINPDGRLDMSVCNRSNDVIWGAYGANAVHMSVLQEVVAAGVGVPVGRYWQISNNFHGYRDTMDPLADLADQAADPLIMRDVYCPYERGAVRPYPMVQDFERWMRELEMFMEDPLAIGYQEPFFRKVAVPMWKTFMTYKDKADERRFVKALELVQDIAATDWKAACVDWLQRRHQKALAKLGEADDFGN